MIKVIYMATPEISVKSLDYLYNSKDFDILAVVTQTDKPSGRGNKIQYSPVKKYALEHDIQVFQPESIRKDFQMLEQLKALKPDYFVTFAFGQILSQEVLDIPKYGCINLHGSLLPMYRGAAPIQWAVIRGEKVSGNTTMLMDVGLDTGDMLLKDEVEIPDNMTAGELYDILKVRGADLLVKTIDGVANKTIVPEKQTEETFYAKMLNKEIANICWDKDAEEIHNLIRGLNPWPIAYSSYKDQRMKIFESAVLKEKTDKTPGTIIDVNKEGIKVACGNNVLLIKKVQFPNGKPLMVEQYINGHDIEKNIILG